jgi:ABC-type branched-subunit amino acid transport system substrate-binding protein
VIGIAVGMLVAGLTVPMAFGRLPEDAGSTESVQSEPDLGSTGAVQPGTGTGGVGGTTGVPLPGPTVTVGPTAAPGSTGTAGTSTGSVTGGTTGSTGTRRLTATDTGVTATAIKLGVVLLDIRSLEPLGFAQPHFTPAEQRQQYQAFIDQVNADGGILGRKIAPVYKTYNALDTNGAQSGPAICIQLAENEKVFAAIGVLGGGMESCLTMQYGIPAINNTASIDETYQKSKNLLVTPFASFERGARNWGDVVVRGGLLKGRTSATVYGDVPLESRPEAALVAAMKADGHTVTYHAKLTGDPASAQSQMPIEVQKMRQAGVNTVFLVTNFVTAIQFVQTADKQGFRPQYMVSDLGSITAEGLVQRMPESFGGAYAVTQGVVSDPEWGENKTCRTYFNAKTGNHYAAGNEAGGVGLFCFMVKSFAMAGRATGTTLTRKALATAFQNLGTPSLPNVMPGTFRPGKTDYSDTFRITRFDNACKCYRYVSAPQRGRY